jgi:hypothetical protein
VLQILELAVDTMAELVVTTLHKVVSVRVCATVEHRVDRTQALCDAVEWSQNLIQSVPAEAPWSV